MSMDNLLKQDEQVAALLQSEQQRLNNQLVLIASENYASKAVMEAQGSVLTNKYAEGYPGQRYYGGCANVDEIERLAISRAEQLFGAEHGNVQPHSGTQANTAVYAALLNPGDTVLSMSLTHGGHISHGSHASLSGHLYKFVHYGVDKKTELLDYNAIEEIARKHKPRLIVAGASAYPQSIDFQAFRRIADSVDAILMVDMAHFAGLVAGGVYPSPVGHAQVITSTTHKTLRGPRGGFFLCNSELGHSLDKAVFPGTQGGPLMHVIAAKAVAFLEAMRPDFAKYQQAIVENAIVLSSELQGLGFHMVSGGTNTHLLLIDMRGLNITGKTAQFALEEIGLSANRNSIPFDPLPPQITSGLRLGTPAVTTRGLGPKEMRCIAQVIHSVLTHIGDNKTISKAREEVDDMACRFPVPGLE